MSTDCVFRFLNLFGSDRKREIFDEVNLDKLEDIKAIYIFVVDNREFACVLKDDLRREYYGRGSRRGTLMSIRLLYERFTNENNIEPFMRRKTALSSWSAVNYVDQDWARSLVLPFRYKKKSKMV